MQATDVIGLTQRLIAFDTVNPPGNESELARFIGTLLAENGFNVQYIPFEANRLHLIAEKGCLEESPPIVFSGHFDTVPLGVRNWTVDPFGGEIKDGKLYGRGSSDMKGGLACMIVAAILAWEKEIPKNGVRLIFTSAEESGCQGVGQLFEIRRNLGRARGIIVGEPTNNIPAVGHKGGLYLKLMTSGVTAHSSMPHMGDNAIYKAARAILKIEKFDFGVENDDLLGMPTVNVGKISGGMNLNSVPDHAEFTLDARTTTKVSHKNLLRRLESLLGEEVTMETLVNLRAVATKESDPFVKMVCFACGISGYAEGFPKSLPYLTDGSVLQEAYGHAPTIILGPGQPEMAHKTDEYVYTANLVRAVDIYLNIILTIDHDRLS